MCEMEENVIKCQLNKCLQMSSVNLQYEVRRNIFNRIYLLLLKN